MTLAGVWGVVATVAGEESSGACKTSLPKAVVASSPEGSSLVESLWRLWAGFVAPSVRITY